MANKDKRQAICQPSKVSDLQRVVLAQLQGQVLSAPDLALMTGRPGGPVARACKALVRRGWAVLFSTNAISDDGRKLPDRHSLSVEGRRVARQLFD